MAALFSIKGYYIVYWFIKRCCFKILKYSWLWDAVVFCVCFLKTHFLFTYVSFWKITWKISCSMPHFFSSLSPFWTRWTGFVWTSWTPSCQRDGFRWPQSGKGVRRTVVLPQQTQRGRRRGAGRTRGPPGRPARASVAWQSKRMVHQDSFLHHEITWAASCGGGVWCPSSRARDF